MGLSGRERHRLSRCTVGEIALDPAVPKLPSSKVNEHDVKTRNVHFDAEGGCASLGGGEAVGRAASAAAVTGFDFSHEARTHQVVHETRSTVDMLEARTFYDFTPRLSALILRSEARGEAIGTRLMWAASSTLSEWVGMDPGYRVGAMVPRV